MNSARMSEEELKAMLLIKHGKVVRDYEQNRWDVCIRQIEVHWHGREFEINYADGYLYEIKEYA